MLMAVTHIHSRGRENPEVYKISLWN